MLKLTGNRRKKNPIPALPLPHLPSSSSSSPSSLISVCCLKVTQLILWPEELRRRQAVISLCLWRPHAVSISLLQRNWYRLMLLSFNGAPSWPYAQISHSCRAQTTELSELHECVQAHTHTHITPSWLLTRSQLRKSRAELVRVTLMEMSCLVSWMENCAELMLISSQRWVCSPESAQ